MPRESDASPLGVSELNYARLNFGRSWVGGAFCSGYRAGPSIYEKAAPRGFIPKMPPFGGSQYLQPQSFLKTKPAPL